MRKLMVVLFVMLVGCISPQTNVMRIESQDWAKAQEFTVRNLTYDFSHSNDSIINGTDYDHGIAIQFIRHKDYISVYVDWTDELGKYAQYADSWKDKIQNYFK